jgi:hypothetical protein
MKKLNDFEVWMINNKSKMIRIYLDIYKDNFMEFCKEHYRGDEYNGKK